MPYSIFFAGGYAIHGTYETAWLGRPASHGCVRLDPAKPPCRHIVPDGAGGKREHHHFGYAAAERPLLYQAQRGAPSYAATQQWVFDPFGR